ncbi:tripartite tricarboxylate transporter substrate binding protein [Synergistaceae bacterium OttesenSCG-928-I11]|nr:tripartite tricarboxylate transporter substrate binding protein [Synergistaceae bacterium OttesenSCG-928-I11]
MFMFKKVAAVLFGIFAMAIMADTARAAFPEKPITIMVPYNPGGGSDLNARTMAKFLTKHLGSPVVVSNKPGGGGFSETARVLKNKNTHDGYTMILLGAMNSYPEIYQQQYPYTYSDFKPIGNISLSVGAIAVGKDTPYMSLKDLVDAAKASPTPIKYSRAASGGTSHLTPAIFCDMYEVPMEDVPYNGDIDSATALLRGEVKVGSANPVALIPHHQEGSIRILAVFAPDRLPSIPDVPTFKEAGFEMPLEALGPISLYAPAGIPEENAKIIEDAMLKVASDPEFLEEAAKVNITPYVVVGDAFDKHMQKYAELIGPMIKKLGLYK